MKLLLIILVYALLTSCAYDPWRYESYYPVESGDYQSGYYESDDHVMKVSVISTEVEPDLRKSPYKLWIKYIDHTMSYEKLKICNLNVTTSTSKIYIQGRKCLNLMLDVGSLVEGAEPYARSAIYEHSEMHLNFQENEKLFVEFFYILIKANGTESKPKEIKLMFEPVLDKGFLQPCCLPSV